MGSCSLIKLKLFLTLNVSTRTDQIKLSAHILGQVRWLRSETLNPAHFASKYKALGWKTVS